jgi:hypothetical protein
MLAQAGRSRPRHAPIGHHQNARPGFFRIDPGVGQRPDRLGAIRVGRVRAGFADQVAADRRCNDIGVPGQKDVVLFSRRQKIEDIEVTEPACISLAKDSKLIGFLPVMRAGLCDPIQLKIPFL